ncbi:hypothetical protein CVT26_000437 [Gymnopilus dilepis]|uniref:Uncharacterized protein n=1 Tax=Gymnopilus dilepis TaxID=231916 RepID=A0A409Y2B1_9AGAR|nr:hypothetical protein CVT26_000437 [Gymnopilus dilepis]
MATYPSVTSTVVDDDELSYYALAVTCARSSPTRVPFLIGSFGALGTGVRQFSWIPPQCLTCALGDDAHIIIINVTNPNKSLNHVHTAFSNHHHHCGRDRPPSTSPRPPTPNIHNPQHSTGTSSQSAFSQLQHGRPRDEAVLLTSQLLAYLSKYLLVKQAFYEPCTTFSLASAELSWPRFGGREREGKEREGKEDEEGKEGKERTTEKSSSSNIFRLWFWVNNHRQFCLHFSHHSNPRRRLRFKQQSQGLLLNSRRKHEVDDPLLRKT